MFCALSALVDVHLPWSNKSYGERGAQIQRRMGRVGLPGTMNPCQIDARVTH